MGAKVDLVEEIRGRISAALGAGNPLAIVKRVRVGSVEDCRKQNDLPIINISLRSGEEVAEHPNRMLVDEMEIFITLLHQKLAQAGNTLYKSIDRSGALYVFETLLNVLDKRVDGVVDNTFSSNSSFLRNCTYQIDESNGNVEITLRIRVKSKYFAMGAR